MYTKRIDAILFGTLHSTLLITAIIFVRMNICVHTKNMCTSKLGRQHVYIYMYQQVHFMYAHVMVYTVHVGQHIEQALRE